MAVDSTRLRCLNEDRAHTLSGLFQGSSALKSDADDELLIMIPFQSPCRPAVIELIAADDDTKPVRGKLWANSPPLVFSDTEDAATLEFACEWVDAGLETCRTVSGASAPLRKFTLTLPAMKFRNVMSMQLFLTADGGSEFIALYGLSVLFSSSGSSAVGFSPDPQVMEDARKPKK
eukprot:TRINITY_DN55607_c0_g1_i1.p1 TRINITY_DN55607_c0_g1~~TRINITY_DN55607_c0_g1_i1.p1  ORF type:complete len:176 (+),score=31.73 TRINITY_DN55607_c0_g1_i1:122-649(+)